jgi:ADP-ribosyl-[dinitrogen reductase] hydrolase
MRLAPVVLYFYPDRSSAVHYAGESSRTTHGAQEAIDACMIFAEILVAALDGQSKSEVLRASEHATSSVRLQEISSGAYSDSAVEDIRGTGYVVDSLEAALWSFESTDSFRDAILAAANLGDDADTTAAICGQIAGAFYGCDGIPSDWIERLAMKEEIVRLADAFVPGGACSSVTAPKCILRGFDGA